MKPLIAIVGNTGVGKSQFAVELAKALNGEIINGDAMQIYQGLDIITNKHPANERDNIPHHLLGVESWNKQITVQDFESKAKQLISKIHSKNKLPILVGGTHYYVQSLIAQNALIADSQNESSSSAVEADAISLQKSFTEEQLRILNDPSAVEETLKKVDPVTAEKFHPNDTRRLRRALEIWFQFGRKASEIYESQRSGGENERMRLRYRVLVFWVWCNRTVLIERLDKRVLNMMEAGLLDEVEEMFANYDVQECQNGIWQVLGFRQFLPYLSDRTKENLDMSVSTMQADTRQYAKKQTKWIRNKLGPLLSSLGGDMALVDSTDLNKWNTDVKERGINLARKWLQKENISSELVPSHLLEEVTRRRQAYEATQWVRHRCDICSKYRGTEVISMGDDELRLHLQSKGHETAVRKTKLQNKLDQMHV